MMAQKSAAQSSSSSASAALLASVSSPSDSDKPEDEVPSSLVSCRLCRGSKPAFTVPDPSVGSRSPVEVSELLGPAKIGTCTSRERSLSKLKSLKNLCFRMGVQQEGEQPIRF